ncbi:MAG TPA: family 20 glycosylhydrolase [Bacteroidales bacterium]|nr:family 20 glycosylhydrolase [Bacteroidales bacterium]HSA43045.1 family 20 glycosylhydrolase [Bacteroidales bacterium]
MMKKYSLSFLLLLIPAILFSGNINIIPKPALVKEKHGSFRLQAGINIETGSNDPEIRRLAGFLAEMITLAGGPVPSITENSDPGRQTAVIRLMIKPELNRPEGSYSLDVDRKKILIEASGGQGIFYGIQSLLQLLPVRDDRSKNKAGIREMRIPCILIEDQARFAYRGMHLDVCRHFFPVAFIKQYLDLMAMYKYNVFHWHLTDDQGWRIQIDQYPKLTAVGAWRKGTQVEKSDVTDNQVYGGFYTKSEIREIVAYAGDRYITVIPEIEMPGHAVAALTAYPEYSCTGGPFEVRTMWGVSDDIFCAGKEATFHFLQDILTEVMELFPSPFIHIGGDEAPKTRWKQCTHCQQRIRDEELNDEHELQSYFVKRIGKFLNANGRKLIGWDEILEGGLAPEATVMSWRGTEGGIEAARLGHDVIMTPGSHCYLDHYQADPAYEPLAIGGFTPLKKVYGFEPVPEALQPEEQQHILGAQANLWTEYIDKGDHVIYMAYPRAIALAEVNWSPSDSRNWDDFTGRLGHHFKLLDRKNIPYCKSLYDVNISTLPGEGKSPLLLVLGTDWKNTVIRYTLDGSEPGLTSPAYKKPFPLSASTTLRAAVFSKGEKLGRTNDRQVNVNLASGKKVSILQAYSSKYPGRGDNTVADGMHGTLSFGGGAWQGYLSNDCEFILDLAEIKTVRSVTATFLKNIYSWIFLPVSFDVSLSADGKDFQAAGRVEAVPERYPGLEIRPFRVETGGSSARYIKIRAKNAGVNPPWHESAGQPCWIFIDEVVVE